MSAMIAVLRALMFMAMVWAFGDALQDVINTGGAPRSFLPAALFAGGYKLLDDQE